MYTTSSTLLCDRLQRRKPRQTVDGYTHACQLGAAAAAAAQQSTHPLRLATPRALSTAYPPFQRPCVRIDAPLWSGAGLGLLFCPPAAVSMLAPETKARLEQRRATSLHAHLVPLPSTRNALACLVAGCCIHHTAACAACCTLLPPLYPIGQNVPKAPDTGLEAHANLFQPPQCRRSIPGRAGFVPLQCHRLVPLVESVGAALQTRPVYFPLFEQHETASHGVAAPGAGALTHGCVAIFELAATAAACARYARV